SDGSLLRRLKQGSQDAASQLYLRYVQRLRALARAQASFELALRIDLEDLVESIFGSFLRGAGQGYYQVAPGEDLWKVLLVIALNKIRAKANYFHAAKRDERRTIHGEAAERILESASAPEASASILLELAVDEAMERLPAQHRLMVQLRIEGYK